MVCCSNQKQLDLRLQYKSCYIWAISRPVLTNTFMSFARTKMYLPCKLDYDISFKCYLFFWHLTFSRLFRNLDCLGSLIMGHGTGKVCEVIIHVLYFSSVLGYGGQRKGLNWYFQLIIYGNMEKFEEIIIRNMWSCYFY